MVGPGRSQEIWAGDSLILQVYGKYADEKDRKANAGSFASQGAKGKLLNDLNEFAVSTQRAGGGNPIALFNLVDILAKDFQQKESPEAYLIYALYDQDSNRYEVGKKVLSKSAANKHEVLEENLYISQDGFTPRRTGMETFVVNETPEDVWFDNMMVMSMSSPIAQETHYDPWGLELTGIGFQYGGIKANKWKFQGQEIIDDYGLNWSSFKWRNYQPEIGRFFNVDPLAEEYY
jgi:RHS repeat-associated protein